eukprot:1934815-Amphidinium_carterae.1
MSGWCHQDPNGQRPKKVLQLLPIKFNNTRRYRKGHNNDCLQAQRNKNRQPIPYRTKEKQ